jgi:hypothetical protein
MTVVYHDRTNGIANVSIENIEPKIAQYYPKSQVYTSAILVLIIHFLKPEIHLNGVCKFFPICR